MGCLCIMEKEEKKQTDPAVAAQMVPSAILQQPITLTVQMNIPVWQMWIRKKLKLPVERKLVLKPLHIGTLMKVSTDILQIPADLLKGDNILEVNYAAMKDHGKRMARIIAEVVVAREEPAPESLIRFILWNFTSTELLQTMGVILRQMNVQAFMISIASIRSLNVMDPIPVDAPNAGTEASREMPGGSIALGDLSVAS